jgi:acetyltransferase
LTILTNAGGPGVLATDALVTGQGRLANLTDQTIEALNAILPAHWSHGNPIDVLGDADANRYVRALEIAAKDESSDGLLVVLTPQGMTPPAEIAQRVAEALLPEDKPVLASWMGGSDVAPGVDILNRAGIPTFPYPDSAARAFDYMWRYSSNLFGLYETPSEVSAVTKAGAARVEQVLREALAGGRTILTESESKQLLSAYGIPVVETKLAAGEEEAVSAARAIGFPVVLKLHSETITHKTDVGGVKLNLASEAQVREAYRAIESSVEKTAGKGHFQGVAVQAMIRTDDAYELILGESVDPQFGPVILFGSGGQLVEVFRDRALALPPLNSTLARRMMERTQIFRALEGVRGRAPVDIEELERLLVRFSDLIVAHPRIREIDINPLLASSDRLIALDARVVLHPAEMADAALPRPAIRPYPSRYVWNWNSIGGQAVTIRPIRPDDEPLMVAFHHRLSDRSVYYRYFYWMQLSVRIAHERLTRMCFIDYDREMALVAEMTVDGERQIAGVARMTRLPASSDAEFAIIVADPYQGRGLGTELLHRLKAVAREEGIGCLTGEILPENKSMQELCRQLGFQLRMDDQEQVVKADLRI